MSTYVVEESSIFRSVMTCSLGAIQNVAHLDGSIIILYYNLKQNIYWWETEVERGLAEEREKEKEGAGEGEGEGEKC